MTRCWTTVALLLAIAVAGCDSPATVVDRTKPSEHWKRDEVRRQLDRITGVDLTAAKQSKGLSREAARGITPPPRFNPTLPGHNAGIVNDQVLTFVADCLKNNVLPASLRSGRNPSPKPINDWDRSYDIEGCANKWIDEHNSGPPTVRSPMEESWLQTSRLRYLLIATNYSVTAGSATSDTTFTAGHGSVEFFLFDLETKGCLGKFLVGSTNESTLTIETKGGAPSRSELADASASGVASNLRKNIEATLNDYFGQ